MTTTAALRMARQLMDRHGLRGWTVHLDKAHRRFGCCSHRKRRITLSAPVTELNTRAVVRDTILHEIAHALVPPRHGHDEVWKRMARRVGAKPNARYGDGVITPPTKYVFRCPKCRRRTEGDRKPWYPPACRECCDRYAGGRWDERFTLTCEDRGGNPVVYEFDKLEDRASSDRQHHGIRGNRYGGAVDS